MCSAVLLFCNLLCPHAVMHMLQNLCDVAVLGCTRVMSLLKEFYDAAVMQAVKDVCLSLSSQLTRIPATQSDNKVSRQRQELAKQFRQQKSRVLQSCSKSLDNQIRKARKG